LSGRLKRPLGWIAAESEGGVAFSLLSLGRFVVAVLTYFRQVLIASYFGLSWKTDAYAIALIIPLLIRQVITNSFGAGFIPVLADVIERKGQRAGNRLVSRLVFWSAVVGVVLVVLLILLGSSVISMVGPGLSNEASNLSTVMVRIMLPMLALIQINGFLLGYLAYKQRFGLQAVISVLEIGTALVALVLGHGIFGILIIPISSMLSVVVAFLVMLFLVARTGLRLELTIDPREKDFKKLTGMTAPIFMGTLLGLLGPVSDKILASFLSEDSVTALSYADRIREIALAVLLFPLQQIVNVSFAKKVARKEYGPLKDEIASKLGWTSLFMFPTAVILTLLATPLIGLLFQRGSFDASNSRLVGYALAFYAPWLAQFGFGVVFRRVFFAMKSTLTPALINMWALVVNVLLNFILIGPMGIGGLALATTVSSTGKTIMVGYFLRKKIGPMNGWRILREQSKLLAAALVMVVSILILTRFLPCGLTEPFWVRLGLLVVWVGVAIGAYLSTSMMFKARSALELGRTVRRLFGGESKDH
jgi:putative peptidoglycan lipid II flippase